MPPFARCTSTQLRSTTQQVTCPIPVVPPLSLDDSWHFAKEGKREKHPKRPIHVICQGVRPSPMLASLVFPKYQQLIGLVSFTHILSSRRILLRTAYNLG